MSEFAKVITYGSIFSASLPLVLLTIRWRHVNHRYFYLLGLLIVLSIATEIACARKVANHLGTSRLLNIQDTFQFVLLMLIYKDFYLKGKLTVLVAMIVSYLGFEGVNSVFLQNLDEHQTWTWALGGAILIGTSIGYYLDLLKKLEIEDILVYPPVWINAAVIFYFSLNLYIFFNAGFVFNNNAIDTSIVFWGAHHVNNIIKNCLFTVAVYFRGQGVIANKELPR
ncbi:MAG TPA: hypothetical protein VL728_10990 [Cyclobacteriaceae bacterium]|jgi:hypothetical protein|nr:hypothetical protein [Cyclobacteriaceae bacterium]